MWGRSLSSKRRLGAAASTLSAATSAAVVRSRAIGYAIARDPVSKSLLLGCPAPFTIVATRLITVSVIAAGEITPPTSERLEAAQLEVVRLEVCYSTSGVIIAYSDCIGVNPFREVRGVHNAEVAADSLGLGLGESGGRSETHEAEGGNDID